MILLKISVSVSAYELENNFPQNSCKRQNVLSLFLFKLSQKLKKKNTHAKKPKTPLK